MLHLYCASWAIAHSDVCWNRIREAAGQTVKSSISHTLVRDTRDDLFMASTGSYLRMKQVRCSACLVFSDCQADDAFVEQEFAGLGGDANFIKVENETSISRSISQGCVSPI